MRLKNKQVSFVTSKDYPGLTASDRIAAATLQSEGAIPVPAVWDDPSVDWTNFDAIIIRSTWDYHLSPARFRSWLDVLERLPVLNPPNILRWNLDKRYLLELQTKKIPIPRTCLLDGKQPFSPSQVRSLLGTDEVVIKPVISASAWNTWRCSLMKFAEKDHERLLRIADETGVIIQEFMPEIAVDGEWSMIFFGEEFSHAVRKYPSAEDFRVQEELGGRYYSEPHPPADLIRQARAVLAIIGEPLLYARIDGIVRSGTFIVMELELIEPSLFFDADPGAAVRFCERLTEILR